MFSPSLVENPRLRTSSNSRLSRVGSVMVCGVIAGSPSIRRTASSSDGGEQARISFPMAVA